ncbi:elongation factor G [Lachnospiraceae bacterium PF1-21]|uniref:Elongation factor G n=1 Tax=Ohessyouella blattaphilus TaxID=2949333 RepID=A0ABT1EDF8_9FIRM|nr:elongation factor G [Ohessyouella blattaphilus]MCP1108735.1 elongation factor G [Ohessyouella blattaphilus]MCR8562129.1 elongation factor G [Ohessyouella blattaphilus]MDL2249363.1 elongation factor G [Lachnospiraceae bacterium OttesenSCG-928-J05]
MNVYRTDEIRNVVLLGHGGSGKTSLIEAMAYVSGATSRMGKVTDGNAISDFDKEEQKRGFSITASLVPIEWEKAKINVLDTPGYFDFIGEVEEAVSAADAAVIVVSGKAGVEVGTEKAWELCDKYKLPRMIYVTEMDVDDASFREVVETLTEKYGKVIAPHFQPIRENEKLIGYVNVIKNAARRYTGVGQREEMEIPEYSKENLEKYREKLLEAVAETSEDFMERYFAGEEFSVEEIRAAMRTEVMDGTIVPVSMGSNTQAQGVANLLSDIVRFFPSPANRKCAGINTNTNEIFEANYDFSKAKSAYVFKTMVDPFIGRYSFIKVCSGVLKGDDVLYNTETEAEEKLGKIYVMNGNKPEEVSEMFAGDIGAIAKLTNTKTGDTLAAKGTPIMYARTEYSKPYTYMRYSVTKKGDEDKVSQALQRLMAEDVTLKSVNDAENRQTLLYGIGDQHLEVAVSKLLDRYKCEIQLETPKVAFRETIKGNSDVDTKYKKQSGGHGQYGHVKMKFEPSGDMDTPFVFEEVVVGGAVPKNYFPAVEKGLADSVVKGPLAGYPVVGVKATLYDGSYHPVDSSEMAFKTATVQAFKKGFLEAGPVLLEPIVSLKVTVPDDFTGDVMGDLNKRRGRVLGMNPERKGFTVIEADIPMTELFGYGTVLRSMTGGRGDYAYEFSRYEQAPHDVQEAEIAKRAEKSE